MEAIPPSGVVDIIGTSGSFAALTENGEVRAWGAFRLLGHADLRIPPKVETIRATVGAFAALHNCRRKRHSSAGSKCGLERRCG